MVSRKNKNTSSQETHFAPAERATKDELRLSIDRASRNPVIDGLLRTVGGALAVLNPQRQILAVNDGVTQYSEARVLNKVTVTKSDARKRGSSDPGGGSKALTDASSKYNLRVLPPETLNGRQVDVIEGRPKPGQKAEFPGLDRLMLYFDRETGLQSRISALDKAGNKLTEVIFTDVVQNPPIDPGIFTYTIPRGAEVEDKTTQGGNT